MEDAGARAILSRLMQATKVNNESALAQVLDVSAQAVHQARKKGQIPPSWVVSIAESYNVNSDWLFFGRGTVQAASDASPHAAEDSFVRMDILLDVVETLEEYLIANRKHLSPEAKAELVRRLCDMAVEDRAKDGGRPARMLRLIHGALDSSC